MRTYDTPSAACAPLALGLYLPNEGERHQAIRFNPNATLQKRNFADGFVPNSGEFALMVGGTNYTGSAPHTCRQAGCASTMP